MSRIFWVGILVFLGLTSACTGDDPNKPDDTETTDNGDDDDDDDDDDDIVEVDGDSDGSPLGEDCDDNEPLVYPGADETPYDGLDNDCDGDIDCDDTDTIGSHVGDLTSEDVLSFCEGYCSRSVEGTLQIEGSALPDLLALGCLASISGSLLIDQNDSLTSLSGLESLSSVGQSVSIGDYFTGNSLLTSLDGLDNLTTIGGFLFVSGNDALVSLGGLDALESVGGYFDVYGNPSLESLEGLGRLESVGGYFYVYENSGLLSLEGLDSLESIGGGLLIGCQTCYPGGGNPALASLDGLEALRFVTQELSIYYNPLLTDLTALYGLESVGADVVIRDNTSLTESAAQLLVDKIGDIGGSTTIEGNG